MGASEPERPADLGLVGLGTMGRNLALNLRDHGNVVVAFDRDRQAANRFLAQDAVHDPVKPGAPGGGEVRGAPDLTALVSALRRPRTLLVMVPAGEPVDAVLSEALPLLAAGDVVIDGGNSHYLDTRRRFAAAAAQGVHFIGLGVSGGSEGARVGPSLMPGGHRDAYARIEPVLRAIAARAPDGEPCLAWLGKDGAGHFVKMVHNGIEYADMQLIAEAYDLMRDGLGLTPQAMGRIFADWNEGPLRSFLIEITAQVLAATDTDGEPLLDRVLDAAQQKGTGRWTAIAAHELASPATMVHEAVAARSLSALVQEREAAAAVLQGPEAQHNGDEEPFLQDLHDALYAAKIVAYAQGMRILRDASAHYGWSLDPGAASSLWRAGCIIRSRFLDDVTAAYRRDPDLSNLLLEPFFTTALHQALPGWRRTVARSVTLGVPAPASAAGLAYVDGLRRARGPANLIQAQRDLFGAHGFERTDRPRGELFHHDWRSAGDPHDRS